MYDSCFTIIASITNRSMSMMMNNDVNYHAIVLKQIIMIDV